MSAEYHGEEKRKSMTPATDSDLGRVVMEIRDSLIRLEPVVADVKEIKKWKVGNGLPGAQFQIWVLWCLFIVIGAILVKNI